MWPSARYTEKPALRLLFSYGVRRSPELPRKGMRLIALQAPAGLRHVAGEIRASLHAVGEPGTEHGMTDS